MESMTTTKSYARAQLKRYAIQHRALRGIERAMFAQKGKNLGLASDKAFLGLIVAYVFSEVVKAFVKDNFHLTENVVRFLNGPWYLLVSVLWAIFVSRYIFANASYKTRIDKVYGLLVAYDPSNKDAYQRLQNKVRESVSLTGYDLRDWLAIETETLNMLVKETTAAAGPTKQELSTNSLLRQFLEKSVNSR